MKAFTLANTSDQMSADLNWRLQEFSDMKSALASTDSKSRPALLRAFLALMYAHWEGHIKFVVEKYFEFLTLRNIKYVELERQLYLNRFLVRLDKLQGSRVGITQKCELINDILVSQQKRFSHIEAELIDTRSNLNSYVLYDICTICGISTDPFSGESDFIDKVILKRRNAIAHGSVLFLEEEDIDDLVDRLLNLMRLFRNNLENKLYAQEYLA